MTHKLKETKGIGKDLILVGIPTIILSILPNILFRELTGSVPNWMSYAKLFVILGFVVLCIILKSKPAFIKYNTVLGVILLFQIVTGYIQLLPFWRQAFDNSFTGNIGSTILSKGIVIIPVVAVLLVLFKSPAEVYLTKGDLSVYAEEIRWLSIKKDTITWGKLSVVSALMISLGTILLTLNTVIGAIENVRFDRLLPSLHWILLFAVANSLFEGILYRSAVLGPLRHVLPKAWLILLAATFFGIDHYYGAPQGVIGVVMSGLLGWYMLRSMYETKGFLSAWIIHFMQDFVIFSTLVIFWNS